MTLIRKGFSFDLRGDRQLIAALKDMRTADQKASVRGALRKAGKKIQASIKANAPRETGQLRKAVKVRAMKRSRVRFGIRVATSPHGRNLFEGEAFYGGFIEFGWKAGKRGTPNRRRVRPNPFIKRGTNAVAKTVIRQFSQELGEEIVKVASKRALKESRK